MKTGISIKRAYDPPSRQDGYRVLVDRLWPRGLKKEEADIDEWAKALAPSTALRKWFGHDPERWEEFRKAYREELKQNKAVAPFVEQHKDKKRITLIYAGKDSAHTHALVLQAYLKRRL